MWSHVRHDDPWRMERHVMEVMRVQASHVSFIHHIVHSTHHAVHQITKKYRRSRLEIHYIEIQSPETQPQHCYTSTQSPHTATQTDGVVVYTTHIDWTMNIA
jgi:hypothetical protein